MRKTETVTGLDFLAPLYENLHSREGLIKGLDSILATDTNAIRAIPFSCGVPPLHLFPTAGSRTRHLTLLNSGDGVHLFKLSHNYKEGDQERSEEGRFFIYDHPTHSDVYVAFTVESGAFFSRALLPLIHSLYPKTGLTFVSHKRLRHLIDAFRQAHENPDIVITRASLGLRLAEEEGRNNREMSAVIWPDMELSEAFDWVYQQNAWFKSLQFEVKRDSRTFAEISLTRQGVVRTNNNLAWVFDSFVQPVCKTISDNLTLFKHRGRLENCLQTRPLTIVYDDDIFAEPSDNSKFIRSVSRLKYADTSVIHGNPYIHMSVIDYLDGSTFDLWVVRSNQVIIVPQLTGSPSAIRRLINHIFDTFAEGSIREYEECSA